MITPNQNPDKYLKPVVWPLHEAMAIAIKCLGVLVPYCDPERIDVAGSIRRQRPQVGDIEVLCVPTRTEKFETVFPKTGGDLFSGPVQTSQKSLGFSPQQEFCDIVNGWKKVKGDPAGRYTQRILPNGMKLDLFMTNNEDYFRQLVIRTGSADFSYKVIASAWKNLGWCGTENGLRRRDQCEKKSSGWVCLFENPTLPPIWESEEDFFRWLGVSYVEPKKRY